MNLGFPRGSVSLVGLELKSVILPRSSPEAGAVGCFSNVSVLSEGASVGLSVALGGGEVTWPDEMTPALPGFPVTLFGGKGFLRGGTGLGGKGGRRVPGIAAGFFVEWGESTDTFLPAPDGFGACLIPVPIPFPFGILLGLSLLGLVVVLFRTGLMCTLSGVLGLTEVVYNLCGAGVVFANSVVSGILVVKTPWVDWCVSRVVGSSA